MARSIRRNNLFGCVPLIYQEIELLILVPILIVMLVLSKEQLIRTDMIRASQVFSSPPSLYLTSLSENLRIGPPCSRPRAGKEASKFLSQLDSHGMQCQAETHNLTVAITEEAK